MTQMSDVEFLEPGDVIFVGSDHTFAKVIRLFQRFRNIPNAAYTHVAIASDPNNVIEAQKGKNARHVPFDEWREFRAKKYPDEQYLVLRHPHSDYVDKLIPVMKAALFHEDEEYAFAESVKRTATEIGRSNCAHLAAKVLTRAKLANLSRLVDDTQVLPGELLEHLRDLDFKPIEWSSIRCSGSPFTNRELIDTFRKDQENIRKLQLSGGSLSGALKNLSENFEFPTPSKAFSYFGGLRIESGEPLFEILCRFAETAIKRHELTTYEHSRGALNWRSASTFAGYIENESSANFSYGKVVLSMLQSAHEAFGKIVGDLNRKELTENYLHAIEEGDMDAELSALRALFIQYAASLYEFVCLAGELPSEGFQQSTVFPFGGEPIEVTPGLVFRANEHPISLAMGILLERSELSNITLLQTRETLSKLAVSFEKYEAGLIEELKAQRLL